MATAAVFGNLRDDHRRGMQLREDRDQRRPRLRSLQRWSSVCGTPRDMTGITRSRPRPPPREAAPRIVAGRHADKGEQARRGPNTRLALPWLWILNGQIPHTSTARRSARDRPSATGASWAAGTSARPGFPRKAASGSGPRPRGTNKRLSGLVERADCWPLHPGRASPARRAHRATGLRAEPGPAWPAG